MCVCVRVCVCVCVCMYVCSRTETIPRVTQLLKWNEILKVLLELLQAPVNTVIWRKVVIKLLDCGKEGLTVGVFERARVNL